MMSIPAGAGAAPKATALLLAKHRGRCKAEHAHRLLHQGTVNLVLRAGALDRLAHGEQPVLGTAEAKVEELLDRFRSEFVQPR